MLTFRDMTLREQLTLTVTLGVLAISFVSSLANYVVGRQMIRSSMVQQGIHLAESLASQSVLALVMDAPDNANQPSSVTMAFPDMLRVEIHSKTGRSILVTGELRGELPAQESLGQMPLKFDQQGAFLEGETDISWRFVAPVILSRETTPFESSTVPAKRILGYVRIYLSKVSLTRQVNDLLLSNLLTLVICAMLLLVVIRHLATRVSKPLSRLSNAMVNVGNSDHWSVAEVSGPRDIKDMTVTFNTMIGLLQRRERDMSLLLNRQRKLSAHMEKVREQQSRAIAQEIHDSLGANLSMLRLGLATLIEETEGSLSIHDRLMDLRNLCKSTIAMSRHITATLRPTTIDTLGLNETIRWLAEDFAKMTRIECAVRLEGDDSLSSERSTALFRIVQESLNNVVRHANATRVRIETASEGGRFILHIEDNGRGLDPEDFNKTGSFGLLGMRERCLYLGGEVDIADAPGGGTVVLVSVPIGEIPIDESAVGVGDANKMSGHELGG